jgi:uncharacterized membrane protein YkoI
MNQTSMWQLATALTMGATLSAGAQEKKLTREQLPPNVASTINRETEGATIKGFTTEREHGKKAYEVETIVNGHTRDLQIAANGTLNEIEEEVAMDALPSEVRSAVLAKAMDAQVTKVESLTKHGKLVAYEAATEKNGHKREIQVGPTGGKLAHEQ